MYNSDVNLEESERLVAAQDRIAILADKVSEYTQLAALIEQVAQDTVWLIERVYHHEKEKNGYREELQLIMDGTHAEP